MCPQGRARISPKGAAMEVVKAWLDLDYSQWANYASVCIKLPILEPACRPFWTLAISAFFFGIGALVVLVIARRIVSYRRKLAAALRAEQERTTIDYDAIAARRWDGDNATGAELGAEEVERRVREAVEQRRAANQPPSPIIVDKK
jgi:hypothetical protein